MALGSEGSQGAKGQSTHNKATIAPAKRWLEALETVIWVKFICEMLVTPSHTQVSAEAQFPRESCLHFAKHAH